MDTPYEGPNWSEFQWDRILAFIGGVVMTVLYLLTDPFQYSPDWTAAALGSVPVGFLFYTFAVLANLCENRRRYCNRNKSWNLFLRSYPLISGLVFLATHPPKKPPNTPISVPNIPVARIRKHRSTTANICPPSEADVINQPRRKSDDHAKAGTVPRVLHVGPHAARNQIDRQYVSPPINVEPATLELTES
jgi:hypothetical protein